jgi:hypothetical protein
MQRTKETRIMTRSALATALAAFFCFGFAAPLIAAPSADAKPTSIKQPAKKCLSDLRAFDSQLQNDGYWMHGSGYGYGYPMYG